MEYRFSSLTNTRKNSNIFINSNKNKNHFDFHYCPYYIDNYDDDEYDIVDIIGLFAIRYLHIIKKFL